MPKAYKTSKEFDRIITKLQEKDKQLYENLFNKIVEILNSANIEHYKNNGCYKPLFLGCSEITTH